jgi:hypothetical protein
MAGGPPNPNPRQPLLWYEAPDLTTEMRDYVLACLRASRPSRLRTQAIDAFTRCTPAGPLAPVDWDGLEAEAEGRGITLPELIARLGPNR